MSLKRDPEWEAAFEVERELEADGIKVWDEWRLQPGDHMARTPSPQAFYRVCLMYKQAKTERNEMEKKYTEAEVQRMRLQATAVAPKEPKKLSVRTVMLFMSLAVGLAIAGYMYSLIGWNWGLMGVVAVVCMPAVFHKYVIPEKMRTRHYFQAAAHYLLVWGGAAVVLLDMQIGLPRPVVILYAVLLFTCFALGAFLPRSL